MNQRLLAAPKDQADQKKPDSGEPSRSTLYAVNKEELVLGSTCPKMRTALNLKANLKLIELQTVTCHKVVSPCSEHHDFYKSA